MQIIKQFKVMAPLATQRTGAHLRFRGQWLCQAGFHPGMRFEVTNPNPGELHLRVIDAAQFTAEDFTAALAAFAKAGV